MIDMFALETILCEFEGEKKSIIHQSSLVIDPHSAPSQINPSSPSQVPSPMIFVDPVSNASIDAQSQCCRVHTRSSIPYLLWRQKRQIPAQEVSILTLTSLASSLVLSIEEKAGSPAG